MTSITGRDVTVVIPSLPERSGQLRRAIESVDAQTVPPADVVVHVDHAREGAHAARNAALAQVRTGWVAFLDDDDLFHPDHLEVLIDGANRSGADLVGTWPQADRPAQDSLACCHQGVVHRPPIDVPWGPEQIDHLDARKGRLCPHCRTPRGSFIMNTNLVRMSLVDKIGGVPAPGSMGVGFAGHGAEDYLFLLKLLDAGARFHHVTGVRTWTYHVKQAMPTRPTGIAREAILTHNALQKGGELAGFIALAMDVAPKVVVEIGSDAGGTLWAWQQLGARVVGVTLPHGPFGSGIALNDHGCEIVYGDSHDPATRDRLVELLDGDPVDVLFIDGDHTFQGVKADFEMFAPLVRPGGVIGFHDICDHPDFPTCKVKAFWDTVEWSGRREEIVTDPPTWGGIGVLRVPEAVAA